jgi:electron transport complex protein RnfB
MPRRARRRARSLGVKRSAVARIDESRCIGCTLCIDACPVDAIVGAQRLLHTVVEPWCTGCKLCLAPCPVDCIEMLELPPDERRWSAADAAAARARGRARRARRARAQGERLATARDRRAVLGAALARAQAKRTARAR